MELIFDKKIWLYLTLFWLLFGMATHISSIFWMLQYGETLNVYKIFDVGFYYYTPVLLWTLYTPVLWKVYSQIPLFGSNWKSNLLLHLVLSAMLAPVSRLMAIALDYTIKNLIGMGSVSIPHVLYETRFIILASTPRAFLFYWIVMGTLLIWQFSKIKAQSNMATDVSRKRRHIWVTVNSVRKKIEIEEIYWIGAARNYINLHTANQCYKIRRPLSSLLEELDSQQFLRIHRSKIVNKAAIEQMTHWRRGEYLITLKNRKLLTSTRTYRQNVRHLLGEE